MPGLKKGDRVTMLQVTCNVLIPNGAASERDVQEWLAFRLGSIGSMKTSNPLSEMELEAMNGSVKWNVLRAGVLS